MKMKKYPNLEFYECEQGSDEWFAERFLSVGSSEAKDSFAGGQGKVRTKKLHQKIRERFTGERESTIETYDMRMGKEREQGGREFITEHVKMPVFEIGLARNVNYPGYHDSPDLLASNSVDGLYGGEIKCPKPSTHARWAEELLKNPGRNCPIEHKVQLDIHCIICELVGCFFLSHVEEEIVPDYLLEKTGGKWGQIFTFVPHPSKAETASYLAKMAAWNVDYEKEWPNAELLVKKYQQEQQRKADNLSAAIMSAAASTNELIGKLQ